MEELFGISMNAIALFLLVVFLIVAVLIGVLAWRNRIMLKLGIRNIPRRRAQTALIIIGLMLSTVIITSAFGTGDTIVYTLRSLATRSMGNTDEVVDSGITATGSPNYFQYSRFEELRDGLLDYDKVDAVVPSILEIAPLIDMTTRQNASRVTLFAPDSDYASDLVQMTTEQGQAVGLDDLAANEVYLDREAAEDLRAAPGDELHLYLGQEPTVLELKAVVQDTSSLRLSVIVMPLSRAQELLGKEGLINTVHVSNRGGQLDGAQFSDDVEVKLESLIEGTGLEVTTVKKNSLEAVDTAGSIFTTIFVGFGLFSIAAGLLLIFLIFMMLAAARKSEMGMARAVGTQRHHLVDMFVFEGTVYDLGAALVGVVLGMVVTYGMAGIMARAFPDNPLDVAYHFEPRSLVVAFTLGMLVTFVTVFLSAWRVSRLNIVRAIRDIPEPQLEKAGRRWLVLGLLALLVGAISGLGGLAAKQAFSLHLGVSMLIIGTALSLRWFGLKERHTFSFAGIALLVWWLLPLDTLSFLGELTMGIEMFFLSGMMMVLGAVWVVTYNLDVLLRLLMSIFGRLPGAVPALRTAIAYPMNNRLRTGLTLAMFSLVIFTMIFMSVTIKANTAVFQNREAFSGGYDVKGTVSYNNPIADIRESIDSAEGLNADDFVAIASASELQLEMRQSGVADEEWELYPTYIVDDAYLDTNNFQFAVMAEGYTSADEIWQALRETPDLAVITADAVPSQSQFSISAGGSWFRLEGVYLEDDVMSPIEVEVREPFSEIGRTLTVIAVMESTNFDRGVYTSQQTVAQVWPLPIPPTTYLFKLTEGADTEAVAAAIESEFLANGMQAMSIDELLDQISETSFVMNSLLQGFMSLGLIVGIAALGVISTRAVVERRHEIGVLRAIGYKRRTVQLGFLLESSIIALLGILIGVALALSLSHNVIDFLKADTPGLEFQVPWVQTLAIAAVAYFASLLMTFLPARQASKIYPAEALRYE